jgi:hypothetical protein
MRDNITIELRKLVCEDVKQVDLAPDLVYRRALELKQWAHYLGFSVQDIGNVNEGACHNYITFSKQPACFVAVRHSLTL